MTKYAICPSLFEHCLSSQSDFKNILFMFLQSNSFKILIDNKKNILERYSKLNDPNNYFGLWLNILESNPSDVLHLISTNKEIENLPDSDAMVILTGSFILERNLATIDAANYAAHTNDINGLGINLIESHKMVAHMSRPKPKAFNSDNLLRDLIEKSKIILEKKFTRRAEDIYNDDFSEFLRGREYYACDQTRSGISPGGVNPGEIDIMIRSPNTGAPESIIESFILNSCGPNNTTISKHLNKLLDNYDTAGLGRNFVLIFSTLSDLTSAWDNYHSYIKDLNNKPDFKTKYSLFDFKDVSARWGTPVNVKIGLATHNRDGSFVEVFHLFINMHIDEQPLNNS